MVRKSSAEAVPEVVALRLPLYLRALNLMEEQEIVSSQALGEALGLTPAQIRKDLSYFGRFGKQGRGYNVKNLAQELRRILGMDREWSMALVGVGRLGRAILDYARFPRSGFKIVAAFDTDPALIGKRVAGVPIHPVSELASIVSSRKIAIGIVAVPATQAQSVIDNMIGAGIRAILNYAPVAARVPPEVKLRDIDPVVAAESMTFYLSRNAARPPRSRR